MADENIWDNWEDLADSSDLDKQVDQHLRMTNGTSADDKEDFDMNNEIMTNNSKQGTVDNSRNPTQFRILPRPVVHEDDINRTAYTPQVKILKRPGHDTGMVNAKDEDKQKSQPARTLAEREAAYAEARKRIMGPVSNQAIASANSNKTRSDNRRSKNSKNENSQSGTVHNERLTRGLDKQGRGANSPR